MKYRCKHCKTVLERDSTKQWVKSYCEKTGRTIHLKKVKGSSPVIKSQGDFPQG